MAKRGIRSVVAIALLVVVAILSIGAIKMNFFSPAVRSYKYARDDSFLLNPYVGYAPSSTSTSLCENATLVYMNLLWSELEPNEGDYKWDEIEENYDLQRWRAEGKNLVLRFVCDLPSDEEHMDIPNWLYDKTGDGEFYDIEYGRGYGPDYGNEVFIQEHEKVIAEIGRHFSGDDFLKYVELGSLGHWGEWHTYYPAGIPRMPEKEIREKYVKPYLTAFPNARLLMRRPFAELPEGFGVFNDMTGHAQDTHTWLGWIENGGEYNETGEEDGLKAAPEIWKKAPVGGEFTSSIPISTMLGESFDETLSMISKSHMTFIGPKVPEPKKSGDIEKQSKEVLAKVGYRYRVSSLGMKSPLFGKTVTFSVIMVNDGVCPIYFDNRAVLYFYLPEGSDIDNYADICDGFGKEGTEAQGMLRFELPIDLMSLQQDESESCEIEIPKQLTEYKGARLYVGIEDGKSSEPKVSLSMSEVREGRLSLLWQR